MKSLFFPAVAVVFALLMCSLALAVYEAAFGVPVQQLFPDAITHFYRQGGYQTTWSELLFCSASLVSCIAFSGLIRIRYLCVPLALISIAWISIRLFHLTQGPLWRIGGEPSWPEYLLYGGVIAALHVFSGLLFGYLWKTLWTDDRPADGPPKAHVGRRGMAGGFTMIELLVVIGVIAVLSAIIFPVLAQSKRNAYYVDDLSKMRQIYDLIVMYQGDHDQVAPQSLLNLRSPATPASFWRSATDSRLGQTRATWPANVWVDEPDNDGSNALLTSPWMISYAYLKPFEGRFPSETSFAQYMADPTVGLILNPASGQCVAQLHGDSAACIFPEPGQPAYNVDSWSVIRTDGSATRVEIPACHGGSFSYEQMFLFWNLCGGAVLAK